MKALSRIHLNGLRAAEAVGRLGSLSGAAEEIGVTVGAVSQHILKLERQLGRPLFARMPRGLRPTRSGERFLTQLSRGMALLDGAVAECLRTDSNMLTLSVAPVFAAKWLVPRLVRFNRLHPEVNVRLEATARMVDLDSADVDLAIRVGDGQWPAFETRLLLPQEIFPVAAPEVAAGLRVPDALRSVPIIRDVNSTLPWSLWLDHFGIADASLPEGPSFTDASLCLEAAIAGQGVTLGWDTLAQDAIAAGKLVVPFAHRASTGLGYWLVSSRDRRATKAMQAFDHWIAAEMGEVGKR